MRYLIALLIIPMLATISAESRQAHIQCAKIHSAEVCINTLK